MTPLHPFELAEFTEDFAGVHLPAWAAWIAQDEDGAWWAYEVEPNQQHNGWYENEVGRCARLASGMRPADWRAMLFRLRPSDTG